MKKNNLSDVNFISLKSVSARLALVAAFSVLGVSAPAVSASTSNPNENAETKSSPGLSVQSVRVNAVSASGSRERADANITGSVRIDNDVEVRDNESNDEKDMNTGTRVNASAGDEGVASSGSNSSALSSSASSDSKAQLISSTDTEVQIAFSRPARLFGFIPVTIQERANVTMDAAGKATVVVRKSWWSFLTSNDTRSDAFKSEIESRINNHATLSVVSSIHEAQVMADVEASSRAAYSANK